MATALTVPPLTDQLTVEAWIETSESCLEGMQALVSQWKPSERLDLFDAVDASRTDGDRTIGYFGAAFDGRYVYFVPEHAPDTVRTHGVVLRYDTTLPFDAENFEAYDASETSRLDTRGYYGAAFDGRFVYFVPRQADCEYAHSRLLRYDTRGGFQAAASWTAFDVGLRHSSQACAFDGRYLYLCPGYEGDPALQNEQSGRVIRYDTKSEFQDSRSYAVMDLMVQVDPRAACFDGGVFDGRYVYFVPLENAVVARYDTQADFDDPAAWQVFDVGPHGTSMFVGGVFDGRWVYLVAYNTGRVVRFDTRSGFTDPGSWQSHDAGGTSGLRCGGYDGGYYDGRFVYFVPFVYFDGPQFGLHAHWLRYDTSLPFDDAAAWQATDAGSTSGLRSFGYNAGAFDGRYFYGAPWRQGTGSSAEDAKIHGTVLRHDTLGTGGSFSLRAADYGHNGGLCAATPGPAFLINTAGGQVFSVAAHRPLPPGRHHLKGVYNGREIRLSIDGELVASREAAGELQACDCPLSVGSIDGHGGRFKGQILEVKVTASALD